MATADYYGGTAQDELSKLLGYYNDRSDASFNETDTNAAERAVGAGGQGFSGNRRGLLRRSEVDQRLLNARQILENQAGRAAQYGLQTQAESARLTQIAAEAKAAMERDQLRERGLLERDTMELAQRDKQSIREAADAIQRLNLTDAAAAARLQAQIASNEKVSANNLASKEWEFRTGQENANSQAALTRAFSGTQAGLNRDANFNDSKLRANTSLKLGQLGHSTFDDTSTDSVLNEIRQRTSGGVVGGGGNVVQQSLLQQTPDQSVSTIGEWEDGTGFNWLQPNNVTTTTQTATVPAELQDEDPSFSTGYWD